MKKISVISVVTLVLFSSVLFSQIARGPGGGGRGGSRGGSRGGPSRGPSRPSGQRPAPKQNQSRQNQNRQNQNSNRSPAMSRPPVRNPNTAQRPTQPRPTQPRPTQPIQNQRPVIHSTARPTLANQAHTRTTTQQFTRKLQAQKINTPQNFASTIQNQTRSASNASHLVRNSVKSRFPNSNHWFNDRFFDAHHSYDFFRNPGANWWWAPAWGSVSAWLPYGWQDPYYYYYPGYTDDAGATTGYVQFSEPEQPSQSQYEGVVTTDAGAWMPLGVFAAGVNETDAAYSNFFFQLAVDKSGQIAGTFYNAATDETKGLAGTVDPMTQAAVWMIADNPDSPVMTTGLYNLTRDATEVQVYFNDEPQPWMLVRVNQ